MKVIRDIDYWLPDYVMQRGRRRDPKPNEPVHLLLCIADHFEPEWNNPTPQVAWSRVANWVEQYPKRFGQFRDADGRPPQHSFFFPEEEYKPAYLDAISQLCHAGFGEVEVHLHHHDDTSENLRRTLLEFSKRLNDRHGCLSRWPTKGELAYGFIHGNWALDNSRPDGQKCGVNDELDILRETGCYADFTMPSAPSPTQTRTINSIYYAIDDPHRPKSHDRGIEVGSQPQPANSLLMVQGPLVLDWGRRKWGLIPRMENGCLQGNQAPSMHRLDNWLRARVQVSTRPDWFFVKLHTHGAPEANQKTLLGEATVQFHQGLALRSQEQANFHVHYVTAREMYNLIRAAEAGWSGTVAEARNYELPPPVGAKL